MALAGAFKSYAEGHPVEPLKKAALKTLVAENARALELMAEAGVKPCFLFREPRPP